MQKNSQPQTFTVFEKITATIQNQIKKVKGEKRSGKFAKDLL